MVVFLWAAAPDATLAWLPSSPNRAGGVARRTTTARRRPPIVAAEAAACRNVDGDDGATTTPAAAVDARRRRLLRRPVAAALLASSALLAPLRREEDNAARALVKGNAPPPKSKPPAGDRPKCTNVEECQALAERRAEQEERLRDGVDAGAAAATTPAGTRYRDLAVGVGKAAAPGDEVTVYYKVLKLGKRSYDGISGEGTTVFSRGYGLEDDETGPRLKGFTTTLGAFGNVEAFNDAVAGMREGGLRRFAVRPDRGWRRPGRDCDGGPGGQGAGGDLKTDYVVVPTATMVAAEACFDTSKRPFPAAYAEQRRMAQRFDQSLIMEVELVKVGAAGGPGRQEAG